MPILHSSGKVFFMLLLTAAAFDGSVVGPAARAQSADVIGSSGRFAEETGMRGAMANRQMADKLYKQALDDEKTAWKSFPPNVSLLARALTASKDAKQADDQAKEFARAALQGLNSASHAGDVSKSKYSGVDQSKMRDLATNSSPYAASVERRLGTYGMKLDPDQMVLKTPMGKFPIGMSSDAYESTLRNVASLLGYNPKDVSMGVQQAIKARQELARHLESDYAISNPPAKSKPDSPSSKSSVGETGHAYFHPAVDEFDLRRTGETQEHAPTGADDGNLDAEKIIKNRRAFLERMGLKPATNGAEEVLADKGLDIFGVIHARYQSMRATGNFIEEVVKEARLPASAPPNQ